MRPSRHSGASLPRHVGKRLSIRLYVKLRQGGAASVRLGLLHSRFHEACALRFGTSLVDRPRYKPITAFETLLFPDGLTWNVPATDHMEDPRALAVVEAVRRLVDLRNRWLNLPEWVDSMVELVPAYPKRPVARDETEQELRFQALTKHYIACPKWLSDALAALVAVVVAAYGWRTDVGDEEALRQIADNVPVQCNPSSTV